MNKALRIGLSGLAFGFALASGLQMAEASSYRTLNTAGTATWSDVGVTPSYATLTGRLSLNAAGAGLDILTANYGIRYNSILVWACSGASTSNQVPRNNVAGTTAGDIVGLCAPFVPVVSAAAAIDDI